MKMLIPVLIVTLFSFELSAEENDEVKDQSSTILSQAKEIYCSMFSKAATCKNEVDKNESSEERSPSSHAMQTEDEPILD